MSTVVYEGPWEGFAERTGDLAGKRVRITVLEPAEPETLDRALAGLIERAERLSETLPPPPPGDPMDWGEAVVEKFRKQGFNL